ncbi:tripartite motif-containing protein 2-like, partial [Anneissia japonica]|uniref:tripartite motif-containing protein 2-like n=1 Tax=Anneissia japonica TaxID=1529436 RepID=UPI0014255B53
MATSPVIKQIDTLFLKCGICLERYQAPKVLPCLHTFCQKCLHNYIPPESLTISCPICRQQAILPASGVEGLQANFFITNLMEVLEKPENNNIPDLGVAETMPCSQHEGQVLEFYCSDCETAVCRKCTVREHCDHTTTLLNDVIEEHKDALQGALDNVKAKIPDMKLATDRIQQLSEKLMIKREEAHADLDKSFQLLEDILKNRKATLLNEMDKVHKEKQSILQKQQKMMKDGLTNMESCCRFTEQALEKGNDTQIFMVKKQMMERLQELANIQINLQPEENDFIRYKPETGSIQRAISNVGEILTNSAIAYETIATGDGLRRGVLGEEMSVTVTSKNCQGELIKTGNASLDVKLEKLDGSILPVEISDNHNGTYEILYKFEQEGNYELHIQLFGEEIKGSPFKVKGVTPSEVSPRNMGSRIPRST